MTLAEVNALDRAGFVKEVGWVFEHSPWVAERAWPRRPFRSVDDLHAALAAEVDAASPDEQLLLLRAHPDLGARAKMSDASASEQSGAGLDSLTHEEFERLRRLNAVYHETFAFPFLYAVKGGTKHDILKSLEGRLSSSRDEELAEALRQVSRIARFRLQELIA
ncbi:MAG: 2-oxo-4-hydroxy-4-carboxy-5-ureidoimidazoline decarboxylase [Vicinamibacterales bacterium]|nr:2-oxo-4-hydroxy-4-carboxy-5-ureidoimidazoline decarboxylase [Vicinamibacterales bacterium]